MENKNKTSKADFDRLNDRVIAEAPKGPIFAIKTNLDSENVYDENPYTPKNKDKDEQFEEYFDDE
ncbi:hypothetical protein [Alkalihalobacillus sp. AL-G]|uniref:hypothetical protein n=1 Tax=Alkalihalobacillus sp. AL-G TaxID=2926399 RepID=UPI00272C631A|nr:hypothetical protein [Alkalihalobacillus sp. AL-G]WLD94808.1 hypothetical protein MOJ78_07980 [Alkalihalobacillus sp. AL-G]